MLKTAQKEFGLHHYNGTDPLHDLAGYKLDELYFLPNGKTVTRVSWDGPLLGWDFEGAVYVDAYERCGLVANLNTEAEMTPLGYKVVTPACSMSYAKVDGKISQEEFDEVVERLRQNAYAGENFQLVDGVFWLNYTPAKKAAKNLDSRPVKEDNGEDNLHE